MPFKTFAILISSVIIASAVTVGIASNLGAQISIGGLFAVCAVLVLRINRTDDK